MKFPSIAAVASELRHVKTYCHCEEPVQGDDDSGWADVRLQVMESGWSVHSGDSSYDQDHRGYWGTSSLDRRSNCRDVARDLIEEAKNHYAETEQYEKLAASKRK